VICSTPLRWLAYQVAAPRPASTIRPAAIAIGATLVFMSRLVVAVRGAVASGSRASGSAKPRGSGVTVSTRSARAAGREKPRRLRPRSQTGGGPNIGLSDGWLVMASSGILLKSTDIGVVPPDQLV